MRFVICLGVLAATPAAAQTAAPAGTQPAAPAAAPPAAPPAAAPPVAAQDKPPAEQELIYQGEATSILGRQVRGPSGELVGRIVDVLVGEAGLARAAVIEFGGFMGLGNRRVAVAWRALRFQPGGGENAILLEMSEDQIKAIPEFRRAAKPADPPVTVAVPPTAPAPTPPATSTPPSAPAAAPARPGAP